MESEKKPLDAAWMISVWEANIRNREEEKKTAPATRRKELEKEIRRFRLQIDLLKARTATD